MPYVGAGVKLLISEAACSRQASLRRTQTLSRTPTAEPLRVEAGARSRLHDCIPLPRKPDGHTYTREQTTKYYTRVSSRVHACIPSYSVLTV